MEMETEERLSIYDANRLGLTPQMPLFQVLYDAYIGHQDLPAAIAYRAADILSKTPFIDPCHAIWMAEREIKPMNLINLTPHDIDLYDDGNLIDTIPASGKFARAAEQKRLVEHINGWAVYQISYGEVEDLPEPQEDTRYIVSQITAVAAKSLGRTDCLIVTDLVRDDKGRIIGARSFARV